jgi:hypothetical protein
MLDGCIHCKRNITTNGDNHAICNGCGRKFCGSCNIYGIVTACSCPMRYGSCRCECEPNVCYCNGTRSCNCIMKFYKECAYCTLDIDKVMLTDTEFVNYLKTDTDLLEHLKKHKKDFNDLYHKAKAAKIIILENKIKEKERKNKTATNLNETNMD